MEPRKIDAAEEFIGKSGKFTIHMKIFIYSRWKFTIWTVEIA